MQVRCKSSFRINQSDSVVFKKDSWYDYEIEIHKDTGMKLYYVDSQPMLERTFKENFDYIQSIREGKINSILNESEM